MSKRLGTNATCILRYYKIVVLECPSLNGLHNTDMENLLIVSPKNVELWMVLSKRS